MTTSTIHSPDNFLTTSWKNGLGKTTELLASNATASDHFAWRLSMATVNSNALFSDFSHHDRTLVLIAGKGLTLHHSNSDSQTLSNILDMASFKGEHQTTPELHDGTVTDFNVITRRENCKHRVISVKGSAPCQLNINTDRLLIYPLAQDVSIETAQKEVTMLSAKHLLQIENPTIGEYVISGGPSLIIQIDDLNRA